MPTNVAEKLRKITDNIAANGCARITRLAANYCRHYDPRYPEGLVAASRPKILAISRWASKLDTR
jgi:hypothetical protein